MNDQQHYIPDESGFNFKRYLGKIFANWPLFVISLIIAYTIAYLINRYTEPVYSVSSTIMVTEEKKGIESMLPGLARLNTKKNLQNEIYTIKSFEMIEKAIRELDFDITYQAIGRVRESKIFRPFFKIVPDTAAYNLTNSPVYISFLGNDNVLLEFEEKIGPKVRHKIGEKFTSQYFNFTVIVNRELTAEMIDEMKVLRYFFKVNDLNQLTKLYQSKLLVSSEEKQSSLLRLSLTGPIPEQAAVFLNKLGEVYIRTNLEEKNMASINAIGFINQQLSIVSDSLRKVEQKMQNFRLLHQVHDVTAEGAKSYERIKAFRETQLNNDLKLRYCDYLEKYIETRSNLGDIIAPSLMGINEPILNAAITDLLALNKERGKLGYYANDENPSVAMLNIKVQKALDALRENLREIKNTTIFQNATLNEKLKIEEAELFQLPATEREFLALKREYDINNSIFSFLLQKRAEAGISKASNLADNKVIDLARTDGARLISPQRSKNYLTALILGLLIPMGIIFLMEFLNNKIVDASDFKVLKKANMLGSVGHNNKDSEIPVFEYPKSGLAESFRALRTNLKYLLRGENEKVILITSTISGEGKTFCAINLATILAMSDKKTLLIALDLRKPRVHKYFGQDNQMGLSTFLIGQSSKEDLVKATNVKNLFLIPSGPTPPNPAELIETPEMAALIEQLRHEFDYIILDTPPVAIVTDAMLLTKYADASIYVVRQNFSSRDVLLLAEELAEKGNLPHLNILVNDVRVPGYYGYSYRYGSRYGYSYHYGYGYSYYSYGHGYYSDDAEKPKGLKDRILNWLGA